MAVYYIYCSRMAWKNVRSMSNLSIDVAKLGSHLRLDQSGIRRIISLDADIYLRNLKIQWMFISLRAIAQSTLWWRDKQINVETITVSNHNRAMEVAYTGCPGETGDTCHGCTSCRRKSSGIPTCGTSCTLIYRRSTWSHLSCAPTKTHP
jgi:hypothetical protein